MDDADDNETWLLDEGDRVIERRAADGHSSPTARDSLIYCLWVADYGMRNAGDLEAAADVHPAFIADGLAAAQALSLPLATDAFSLPIAHFEERYFDLFDSLVTELRQA